MTNEEIIIKEALDNNIFSQTEIDKYVKKGIKLPFHTFNVWSDMGYKVKKGEKGFATHLWKYKTSKEKNEDKEQEGESKDGYCYYLAKAYLFTLNQVEKVVNET